ncbi:MAG: DMT family transporter [bacterium]
MGKLKGISLVIFATVVYGFIPFFAKTAFENGFNEYSFILGRCIFGCILIYLYMKKRNTSFKLNKEEIISIIKVSILGHGLMILTLVYSYNYMPTSIATAIHFVYPIIIMVGGVKYYGEILNIQKVTLIIIAVIGIFLIAGLDGNINIDTIGLTLALVSGILYAYYVLELGSGNLKHFNPIKLIFYVLISNAFLFFIASIALDKLDTNITKMGWYNIVIASILLGLAMISFKKGLESITVVTAAILSTFEPLTSLIVGVVILNETLKSQHIIGSILIIISAVLATIIENKSSKKTKLNIPGELK